MRIAILMLFCFWGLISPCSSRAQQPPLPGGGGNPGNNNPVGGGSPVGEGLTILITLAAGYGFKKIKKTMEKEWRSIE